MLISLLITVPINCKQSPFLTNPKIQWFSNHTCLINSNLTYWYQMNQGDSRRWTRFTNSCMCLNSEIYTLECSILNNSFMLQGKLIFKPHNYSKKKKLVCGPSPNIPFRCKSVNVVLFTYFYLDQANWLLKNLKYMKAKMQNHLITTTNQRIWN